MGLIIARDNQLTSGKCLSWVNHILLKDMVCILRSVVPPRLIVEKKDSKHTDNTHESICA